MKKSKWEEDAEFYTEEAPAWWEIGLTAVVMVLVVAILVYSSWAAS
jgi:hypothetical protein